MRADEASGDASLMAETPGGVGNALCRGNCASCAASAFLRIRSTQILRIEINLRSLKHPLQFAAEIHLQMTLFLVCDVFLHRVPCRRADGEGGIALLPRESPHSHFVLNPRIRCLLYFPHYIREPVRGLQSYEEMHMVRNAARALSETVQPVDSASPVFMQPHSPGGMKPRLSVLRAKDEVVMQTGVGAGHGNR